MMDMDSLPTEVKNAFDDHDQHYWLKVYNDIMEETNGDSEFSKESAWMECRRLDSSRYVCANVSTEIVDHDGDLAVVKEYVAAGQELVRHGGILTKNHSNKIIGTVWKVEEGIDAETQKPCVVAYMNFFRGTMLWDTAWNEFKAGRTEFSIGSLVKKPERHCDFKGCYNILIPEQWFELSNVDRGINPRTYPVEVNEEAKGYEVPKGVIVDMHEDVCPVKAKYLRFKQKMHDDFGLETNYGEDFILVHGALDDESLAYVLSEYPEIRGFEYKGDDDVVYTLITPEITVNEVDAGVDTPAVAESDATEERVKGPCPAGQHEHAGVRGCHDILRRHHQDYRTSPSDTMNLTDENIDISAIQETPTDKLRSIVTKIASVLSRYSDDAVQQFLSSTQGKEFILAFLELKRRKQNGDMNMAEKDAGCSASVKAEDVPDSGVEPVAVVDEVKAEVPATEEEVKGEDTPSDDVVSVDEAEKGSIPDIQSSIANISSTLASLASVVDQMNIRLMKLEDSDTMSQDQSGGQNISDAILSATQEDGEDGAPAIPGADSVSNTGTDGEGNVPPQFEKNDDDGSPEEGSDKPKDDESKDEDAPKEGESDDDKSSDESKDDESKDDDKKDEESKDSDKPPFEKKDEDKKEDEKKKDDEEKKKGEVEDAPVATEPVPESAPSVDSAESVVKTDVAPVAEPAPAPAPAEVAPATPAPAPAPVKDDFEIPVPSGGQAVDFRAMLLKRQTELAQKGVQLYIADVGTQNSLATVPLETIKGTNVTLVRPSNSVKVFDPELGIGGSGYNKNMWSKIGTMDSETFLKKLIG